MTLHAPSPTEVSSPRVVPVAGDRRRHPAPAHLVFFHGPMDCGKSTLALQVDHNQSRQGRQGLLLTQGDRSAEPRISSRVGLQRAAVELGPHTDVRLLVRERWSRGHRDGHRHRRRGQLLDLHVDAHSRSGGTLPAASTARRIGSSASAMKPATKRITRLMIASR